MSAFVTRKSILGVMVMVLVGLFFNFASISPVEAQDPCAEFGLCDPCEIFGFCDPCFPFGCGPCEFFGCGPCFPFGCHPCEIFGDCDPCEIFGDCDPCEIFDECDPVDPEEEEPIEEEEEEPVVVIPAVVPAAAPDAVACDAGSSSMEVTNRNTVVIYGTAEGGTKGTLFIAEIPLSAIRHITEEERARGLPIWILSYDSPIVEGWHVDIYWQNEHYGAHIVGNGGAFVDDTGATCAL